MSRFSSCARYSALGLLSACLLTATSGTAAPRRSVPVIRPSVAIHYQARQQQLNQLASVVRVMQARQISINKQPFQPSSRVSSSTSHTSPRASKSQSALKTQSPAKNSHQMLELESHFPGSFTQSRLNSVARQTAASELSYLAELNTLFPGLVTRVRVTRSGHIHADVNPDAVDQAVAQQTWAWFVSHYWRFRPVVHLVVPSDLLTMTSW